MTYLAVLENQKKWLIAILVWLVITIAFPNIINGIFLIISGIAWFKTTLLRIKLEDKL